MSLLAKIFGFILLSWVWWCFAIVMIFVTVVPCGMGPDADCDMISDWTIWVSVTGSIVGYIGLCGLLYRRWAR